MLGSLLAYDCDFRSLWTRFESALGSLWDTLGHFGVIFGPLWGHFGITLGPIWDYFAHFGLTLRSLWPYEGRFRVTLVRFQKTFISTQDFDDFMQLCDHLGLILGSLWAHLWHTRVRLDHFWIALESLWGHFGIASGI